MRIRRYFREKKGMKEMEKAMRRPGHWFGNGEPKDAAGVVQTELKATDVSRVEFSPVSDLVLWFANGRSLQVLAGSGGYENWHVYGPNDSHTYAIGSELRRDSV